MKLKKCCFLTVILVLVLGLASCAFGDDSTSNTKLSAEEIYEKVSPSVVVITAESPTAINSGTGFFYNNGALDTAFLTK